MKITASLIDIIGTRRLDRASTGRTGREEKRYGRREKRRSKRIDSEGNSSSRRCERSLIKKS